MKIMIMKTDSNGEKKSGENFTVVILLIAKKNQT